MYQKKETFTFMHCWKLLRNEAKWSWRFLELNNRCPDQTPRPSTQGHTMTGHAEAGNESMQNVADHSDTTQPESRDSAKRHRSKTFPEASSSSAAVEVLQRLHEKSEKTELKQDQQMAEILNRKDGKIKIQRDLSTFKRNN